MDDLFSHKQSPQTNVKAHVLSDGGVSFGVPFGVLGGEKTSEADPETASVGSEATNADFADEVSRTVDNRNLSELTTKKNEGHIGRIQVHKDVATPEQSVQQMGAAKAPKGDPSGKKLTAPTIEECLDDKVEAMAKAAPRAKRGIAAAAEVVVDEAEAKAAPRAKRGNAVINQAAVVVHQSAGAGAHKNVRNAENAVEEPSKRARGDRFKSAEVGEESTLMLDIPTPTRDRKRKSEETKSNSIDVGPSAKKEKTGLVDREHGTPTAPAHQPKFAASKMEASSQVHSWFESSRR